MSAVALSESILPEFNVRSATYSTTRAQDEWYRRSLEFKLAQGGVGSALSAQSSIRRRVSDSWAPQRARAYGTTSCLPGKGKLTIPSQEGIYQIWHGAVNNYLLGTGYSGLRSKCTSSEPQDMSPQEHPRGQGALTHRTPALTGAG